MKLLGLIIYGLHVLGFNVFAMEGIFPESVCISIILR